MPATYRVGVRRSAGSPAGVPVSLVAQLPLNPDESGAMPLDTLRNSTDLPMEIHGMRWTIDAQIPEYRLTVGETGSVTNASLAIGSLIEASLSVGETQLTAQQVPLYLFGRSDAEDIAQVPVGGKVTSETSRGSYCSGIWRFDYPMRLMPGEAISAQLQHKGLVQGGPAVTTLAFVGRAIGRGSRMAPRRFPYVAPFAPPAIDASTASSTAPIIITSTERDLVNKSGKSIVVHRFVGRCATLNFPFFTITNFPNFNIDWVFPPQQFQTSTNNAFTDPAQSLVLLSMRSSDGIATISNPTAFRQVFEPNSRSWECTHILPPDSYYIAQFTINSGLTGYIQPAMAMIGYQGELR